LSADVEAIDDALGEIAVKGVGGGHGDIVPESVWGVDPGRRGNL
jgi:hypothetical protein